MVEKKVGFIGLGKYLPENRLTNKDLQNIVDTSDEWITERTGIKGVPAFYISVACSGFIYGIAIANQFVKSGVYKYVLLIAAEKMSSVTDWTDRSTCVLMGDGAGAAILGEVQDGGILSAYLGADGSKGDLLKMPAGGSRLPATISNV